tara:strand:- start:338 stop:541 length:204 start_codon:yes stop_codon:yes gene_type:complete
MVNSSQIIAHVKKLEFQNKQDFIFVFHADGSGCFENYFSTEVWQHFDNLKELEEIVLNEDLKEIKIK